MSEIVTSDTTVITDFCREKLCKITSGAISSMSPVAKIAFGDGGVDEEGEVIAPDGSATALNHQVAQYDIDSVTYPIPTTAHYTVTIPADDLVGTMISEAALVDSGGNLLAIRTMLPKGKDSGSVFKFEFNHRF